MPYLPLMPPSCSHIDTSQIFFPKRMPRNYAYRRLPPIMLPLYYGATSARPLSCSAPIWLGSDLEEIGSPGTGWSVILGSSTYPQGKASVFKIPHHGSHTADHPQVWHDMLDAEPYAVLTPFSLGRVALPTRQDIDRICARTAQVYTTAIPRHRRRRERPNVVEKTLRETVRSLREIVTAIGHIRLRADLATQPLSWRVELFGDAQPLRQLSIA